MWFLIGLAVVFLILGIYYFRVSKQKTANNEDTENIYPLW